MTESKETELFKIYIDKLLQRFPIPHHANCMNCGQQMITELDIYAPPLKDYLVLHRPLTCNCSPKSEHRLTEAKILPSKEIVLNRTILDSR